MSNAKAAELEQVASSSVSAKYLIYLSSKYFMLVSTGFTHNTVASGEVDNNLVLHCSSDTALM